MDSTVNIPNQTKPFAVCTKDKFMYEAAYGTVYEGTFGDLPSAFKFYRNLKLAADRCYDREVLALTAVDEEVALVELQMTKDIVSPHIVSIYDVLWDPFFENVVLVFELPFNNLFEVVHYYSHSPLPDTKELTSTLKLEFIRDVVLAVEYLHDVKGIIHTDINTQNILLFQTATGNIIAKLGGLGVDQYLNHLSVDKVFGYTADKYNKVYLDIIAPELLGIDGDSLVFTKQSDIWALGITMNEIMTERPPYPHAESYDYYIDNIKGKGKLPNIFIPNGSNIETFLRNIIIGPGNCCLAKVPENRSCIAEISNIFTDTELAGELLLDLRWILYYYYIYFL